MLTQQAQKVLQDYDFHTKFIHRFVDGITHAESGLQLPFEHNCMNWLLGHIVTNRSHVLETVGATHAWQDEVRAMYHTGTPPITPDGPSIQFETLVKYLDESVGLLEAALENVSDEYLEENHSNYRGEKTRYGHLTSSHWHEDFHIGQLEILKAFIESNRT
jgi:hypothetical protein